MSKFICDSDELKRRITLLKRPLYVVLALFLFTIYYKPELFVSDGAVLSLLICTAVFMFFDFFLRHYQHALELHGTEELLFSDTGFEFTQKSTGYNFVKRNEDILSVDYHRFLGAPRVRVNFENNEIYDFKWFQHSDLLYKEFQKRLVNKTSHSAFLR